MIECAASVLDSFMVRKTGSEGYMINLDVVDGSSDNWCKILAVHCDVDKMLVCCMAEKCGVVVWCSYNVEPAEEKSTLGVVC